MKRRMIPVRLFVPIATLLVAGAAPGWAHADETTTFDLLFCFGLCQDAPVSDSRLLEALGADFARLAPSDCGQSG